jgi:eukaryotic-like serine/threonine-protein kinase
VIGTLVGGYRVVTERGRGPTGTVYFAEHPVIGRRAAIKLIAPEFSEEARLDKFLTHLKVTSGIRHPNIVDVLDIGRIADPTPGGGGDVTFVVMEMLEGESLDERLERDEMLDEQVVVRLIVQIASALSAAHDRGLAHAALKPANIFITNSTDYPDFVKLLDFGAAILRPQGDPTLQPYRAPELSQGVAPGPSSDLYALGVVAYEMLVGSPP